MKFPEYNPDIDYFDLSIQYETTLVTNKNKDYHYWKEVLENINQNREFWYKWHMSNLCQQYKKTSFKEEMKSFEKINLNDTEKEDRWCFITIGFNEQTITPAKMLKVCEKVSKLKYFTECEYVLEKHRENGIHHHTHFLVKYEDKLYLSKLIDWIFQTSGIKEVCLSKSFIDILGSINKKKHYEPFQVYYDYIRGIKREEKLKYVSMDKEWRKENNINDLFSKK